MTRLRELSAFSPAHNEEGDIEQKCPSLKCLSHPLESFSVPYQQVKPGKELW